jgi:translation initiation factor IF-1
VAFTDEWTKIADLGKMVAVLVKIHQGDIVIFNTGKYRDSSMIY